MFKKQAQRFLLVGLSVLALSGTANAAGVLGNIDFSSISSEVTTAAAALAAVFVVIAGARIALGGYY